MGIRDENKKQLRDKILLTARDVIAARGFEDTTMEQISD